MLCALGHHNPVSHLPEHMIAHTCMHGGEMMHGVCLAEIGVASQTFEQPVIRIVSVAGNADPLQLLLCGHHEAVREHNLLDNLRAAMLDAALTQRQECAASKRVPLEHPSVHTDALFANAS